MSFVLHGFERAENNFFRHVPPRAKSGGQMGQKSVSKRSSAKINEAERRCETRRFRSNGVVERTYRGEALPVSKNDENVPQILACDAVRMVS